MFGRGELKPHTFPLRYSPLNGEMSALALTEGSVCASKRVIPLIREMSSLRDKRMTLAVDEVFSLFTTVKKLDLFFKKAYFILILNLNG